MPRNSATRVRDLNATQRAAFAALPEDIFCSDGSVEIVAVEAAAGEGAKPSKVTLAPAYSGGLLRVDNFPHPVVLDLATLKVDASAGGQIPLLYKHNSKREVGHVNTSDIVNDGKTLNANGVLSVPGEDRDAIQTAQRDGFNWRSSVGVRRDEDLKNLVLIPRGQRLNANGQTFVGPVIFLRNGSLRELSFVGLGGDDKATARLTATSRNVRMAPALLELVEAAGFTEADVINNPTRLKFFEDQLEASGKNDDDKKNKLRDDRTVDLSKLLTDELKDVKASLQTEVDTLKKTNEALARKSLHLDLEAKAKELGAESLSFKIQGKDINLLAHAKEEGWTVDKFALEALLESRHKGPAGYVHASAGSNPAALVGSLMLRAGVKLDSNVYGKDRELAAQLNAAAGGNEPCFLTLDVNAAARDKAMNDAYKLRGMSLVDLCRQVCQLEAGYQGYNQTEVVHAAMSSNTLSWIFTTNFAAQMIAGWDEEQDTTQGWCFENRDVPNFLLQERGRMIGVTELTKHTAGGSADHANASDNYETYRIERFSRQFVVDEIDIINDRFGALAQTTPMELGRAAKRVRPNLVYGILKRNPNMRDTAALMSAARGNKNFSSALAAPTLKASISAFQIQTESGVILNLNPTHYIGPPTLRWTIAQLLQSTTIVGAASGNGDKNTLESVIPNVVNESRLELTHNDPSDNTNVAGSTSTWYLANAQRPPIEVGLLRGGSAVPGVTNWKKNGEDGQYLVGFSVKHDIGAKAIRYQTIQQNVAAAP